MSLIDKIYLCYVNVKFLEKWIKENNLLISNFAIEKEKWKKEVNCQPSFFSDTEFLLINDDIILLKVLGNNHAKFLANTYQLEWQKICQKIFQEKKNIILVNEKQWKVIKEFSSHKLEERGGSDKEAMVLLKDKENIEKVLINWVKN